MFLWMRLFDNHIVRFPVERSVVGMAWNLSQALLSSVHGSARVFPGALYVALLLGFCRTSRGLKVTAYLLAMFAIGYLPFLLVHGFANRFAYGSSAAAAIWLAYALADLRQTRFAALSAPAILVFFAVGMQNRITSWNRAGEIARDIPAQIKLLAPTLPPSSTIIIDNVPLMYRQAYVFISGLQSAMERAYGEPLHVETTASQSKSSKVFRWTGERVIMVRP